MGKRKAVDLPKDSLTTIMREQMLPVCAVILSVEHPHQFDDSIMYAVEALVRRVRESIEAEEVRAEQTAAGVIPEFCEAVALCHAIESMADRVSENRSPDKIPAMHDAIQWVARKIQNQWSPQTA